MRCQMSNVKMSRSPKDVKAVEKVTIIYHVSKLCEMSKTGNDFLGFIQSQLIDFGTLES